MKSKTILLLIPNLDYGGAQRAFFYLSEYLSPHYCVLECVFNTDTGIAYQSKNELIDLKIPAGKNFLDKILRFFTRVRELRKIKRERNVDLCISMLEGADYVNILSKSGEKTWLCVQGSKMHDRDIRYKFISRKVLIPFLYNKADTIISVSKGIKQELELELQVKVRIEVIENPYDHDFIKKKLKEEIPSSFEAAFNTPVITTSGRLHEQKNQTILFRIMEDLISTHKYNCRLIVLGDGPWRQKMEEEALHYELKTWFGWNDEPLQGDENIIFTGFTDNPFTFIQKSQLFALPSAWEGFPLALIEAMATQTAVIAADCPTGPKEILSTSDELEYGKQDFGSLLEIPHLENYEEWVSEILNILHNRNLRKEMEKQGAKRASEFTTEIILGRWKQEIDKLWSEHSNA